ncbi:MAG: adenylosuccinate synthetase [Candidatus Altiarchaeales archaeon]|nr:MAG: adenylosuccinate synthetase [Candidatus Altiarchaeales archaeon]RLI93961.1 MAG: adenylosuccinate synthetase [Candidatus Altiarchaeales archaeon]RLI95233.1 MAG: adenylosuccinate synthetase [Candidatus Altiarchaeales archaeon]HDO82655.1 adenylosuccinate synthetase [Candidatus Altiarchaeales archaeon]HEX55304.1 adenylosuccinate synthetase [Candidatus Altiarchaeales archaeon]
MVTIVVGGHFGDEGKGKIISYLALKDNPDIVARAGVGPNAGHTVYKDGKEYGLRMIPCGFVNERSMLFIGAGVLIDPERFLSEVEITKTRGRIFIDKRCGVIEEKHKVMDSNDSFLHNNVGTTGSGCGPANAERAYRRIKLAQEIEELEEFLIDAPLELNNAINNGKKILIESSQGFGLSLFYGTYPYVTSKDTSAGMAAVDVGIGPTKVRDVIVIYKSYTTRVGGGPLKTLITEENIEEYPLWKSILKEAEKKGIKEKTINDTLAKYLNEKGTVTRRQRRIGDFDISLARYSAMVNSATQIGISCLDKLFPECHDVREWDDLSERGKRYVERIENEIGVPITLISTGPEPYAMIDLREEKLGK